MNTHPNKEGVLTLNAVGIGAVSRRMLRERAVELAIINGRSAQDVSKNDWEDAKRELSGEPDVEIRDNALESIGASAPWDPSYGGGSHKIQTAGSEDEDADGRSDQELLMDEGIAGAEHDQMLQAALLEEDEEMGEP
jgi:hypothetical protein